MQMSKNLNNDVGKDSPINYEFYVSFLTVYAVAMVPCCLEDDNNGSPIIMNCLMKLFYYY